MKILIVTHYFKPHVGGIEIVAYNQAKGLVEEGHEVTIVTSKFCQEFQFTLYEPIDLCVRFLRAL